MKELTLEHLAPYLPYSLKFYRPYLIYTGGENPQPDHDEWGEDEVTLQNVQHVIDSGMPLILRPLSDIQKPIVFNGKEIIPLTYYKGLQHDIEHNIWMGGIYNFTTYATYLSVKVLLQWHFDVFGLIERGLAIDIKTINP